MSGRFLYPWVVTYECEGVRATRKVLTGSSAVEAAVAEFERGAYVQLPGERQPLAMALRGNMRGSVVIVEREPMLYMSTEA